MKLFESRTKSPSKWTKIKNNNRNVRNSYNFGDIYDTRSGSYSKNDMYTDTKYIGYILDKDGNEYEVEGKSIHGDSGRIAGGSMNYYVNIILNYGIIKLYSYSGIMSHDVGSAIIDSINDGYYLEDYLYIYKNNIKQESQELAKEFIQNGSDNVKSALIDKKERKEKQLLNKKNKFLQLYKPFTYISAEIDDYGEWHNIKIDNEIVNDAIDIENLIDDNFNSIINAPKYNYAGIKFIIKFNSSVAYNKQSYNVIRYDAESYKITNDLGYPTLKIQINPTTVNKDLKRALIHKWQENNKLSGRDNYYKNLIQAIKTSDYIIEFNNDSSYNKYAHRIKDVLVSFERKPLKVKKLNKPDEVKSIKPVSSTNYPKIAYDKMLAWHNGTRKQNVGAMGDEKLKMNYEICIEMGYTREANILKSEAEKRNIILEAVSDRKILESLINKYGYYNINSIINTLY